MQDLTLVLPLEKAAYSTSGSPNKLDEEDPDYLYEEGEDPKTADLIDALYHALHTTTADNEGPDEEIGNNPLRKAWSESAREASIEARGHVGRIKRQSSQYTGLRHKEMNKSGFIKVRSIKDEGLASKGRDYNSARAALLKSRAQLGKHVLEHGISRPHKIHQLAADYHHSHEKVTDTGHAFREHKRSMVRSEPLQKAWSESAREASRIARAHLEYGEDVLARHYGRTYAEKGFFSPQSRQARVMLKKYRRAKTWVLKKMPDFPEWRPTLTGASSPLADTSSPLDHLPRPGMEGEVMPPGSSTPVNHDRPINPFRRRVFAG